MGKWTFRLTNNDILLIKKEIQLKEKTSIFSLFESKDLNNLQRIKYNLNICFYSSDKYLNNLEELYDYINNNILSGYFYEKYKFDEDGNRRDNDDSYNSIFYSLEYEDLNDFDKKFFNFCLKHSKFKETLKRTLRKIPNLYKHYFENENIINNNQIEKKEICYSKEGVIEKIIELKNELFQIELLLNNKKYIIKEIIENKIILKKEEQNIDLIYDIDFLINLLDKYLNNSNYKNIKNKLLEELKIIQKNEEQILLNFIEINNINNIEKIKKEYHLLKISKDEILENLENFNLKYSSFIIFLEKLKEYKIFINYLNDFDKNLENLIF